MSSPRNLGKYGQKERKRNILKAHINSSIPSTSALITPFLTVSRAAQQFLGVLRPKQPALPPHPTLRGSPHRLAVSEASSAGKACCAQGWACCSCRDTAASSGCSSVTDAAPSKAAQVRATAESSWGGGSLWAQATKAENECFKDPCFFSQSEFPSNELRHRFYTKNK